MELESVSRDEYNAVCTSKYSSLFPTNPDEDSHYAYMDDVSPIGWTNNIKQIFEPMNVSRTVKGKIEILTVVYSVSSPHHILKSTNLTISVPPLALKKQYVKDYRFKMADYFGYYVSTNAQLTSGMTGTPFKCTLTPYDQIVLCEHMTEKGRKKGVKQSMGFGNICTNWTTEMKGKTVVYPQQFGYSFTQGKALKLKMFPKNKQVYHKYEFDLHIKNHINLQRFNYDLGEYEDIAPDMSLFEGTVFQFAQPMLYGEFSDVSPSQASHIESEDSSFYIYDMMQFKADNKCEIGSNARVSLRKCKGLAQAMFFSLQNVTEMQYNKNCNYTSGIEVDCNSVSGIHSVSVSTNNTERTQALAPDLFLNSKGLRSYCEIPGIFCDMYVDKIGHGNNGGSLPQKTNTEYNFLIDPYLDQDHKFQLCVSVLVLKKVCIKDGNVTVYED